MTKERPRSPQLEKSSRNSEDQHSQTVSKIITQKNSVLLEDQDGVLKSGYMLSQALLKNKDKKKLKAKGQGRRGDTPRRDQTEQGNYSNNRISFKAKS